MPEHTQQIHFDTDHFDIVDDNIKHKNVHGGGYITTSVDVDATNSGTPYKVNATFTAWPSHLFLWDDTNKRFRYTGPTKDIKIDIDLTGSVDTGLATTVIYRLYLNGSNNNGIQRSRGFNWTGGKGALSMGGILELKEDDYLELYVECDRAGTKITTEEIQVIFG